MPVNPIVIKYGGSLLEDPAHRSAFLKKAAALSQKEEVVLIHGGGKEITRQMEKSGLQPRFIGGRRYTDDLTMTVVKQALSGLNRDIVSELIAAGAQAEGFSGEDGQLLEATPIAELGRVGYPRSVDQDVLATILKTVKLPVFYSVGVDIEGKPLNINADDFALALSVACRAQRLVYLTDSGGIRGSDGKLIPYLSPREVDGLIKSGVIKDGMVVKARACVRALQEGVGRVDIVQGIDHLLPSSKAAAEGTVFMPEPEKRN